ncbi:hypothetical protein E3N88_11890 [Mikania micrantha]|uniref:Uncharacterized protein n=1 Tax=Mikania micrantha TaxID=192012 RepID=A0A5N6P5R5_9ASTR|nr:hypothetical protein E3N88_11890 [Mikania micrantha]
MSAYVFRCREVQRRNGFNSNRCPDGCEVRARRKETSKAQDGILKYIEKHKALFAGSCPKTGSPLVVHLIIYRNGGKTRLAVVNHEESLGSEIYPKLCLSVMSSGWSGSVMPPNPTFDFQHIKLNSLGSLIDEKKEMLPNKRNH